jgi:hypothetical protein
MNYEEIKEILTKNAMNYNEFLFTMLLKDTTKMSGLLYDDLWRISKELHDVYTRSEQSKQVNKSDHQCMMEWISVNKQLINILTND